MYGVRSLLAADRGAASTFLMKSSILFTDDGKGPFDECLVGAEKVSIGNYYGSPVYSDLCVKKQVKKTYG